MVVGFGSINSSVTANKEEGAISQEWGPERSIEGAIKLQYTTGIACSRLAQGWKHQGGKNDTKAKVTK